MQDGVNFEFKSQGKKHWQCQLSRLIDVDTQSTSVLPTPSFSDAETEITGELRRGKGQASKRNWRVDLGFKETSALKNPKFDNSKKDEDVEFDTCLPQWDTLMLLYNMLHDKAQNLNYGSIRCLEKNTDVH